MKATHITLIAILTSILTAPSLTFAETEKGDKHAMDHASYSVEQNAKHNWKQAKLDAIFTTSSEFNAFTIDTEVIGETAILKGAVDSETKKKRAKEKALNIEGISTVKNQLIVDTTSATEIAKTDQIEEKKSGVGQAFIDASITASIKAQLIGSDVKARNVSVNTTNNIVILRGNVDSEIHKALAENIAKNTNNVVEVVSELQVNQSTAAK